ncbi:hypothetical protein BX600DRAFT_473769 [Xylariales sp. PMI_506]|nr:hypothetical protein BX600DRAFT_473769 [Xylariales sp. PMI_506]
MVQRRSTACLYLFLSSPGSSSRLRTLSIYLTGLLPWIGAALAQPAGNAERNFPGLPLVTNICKSGWLFQMAREKQSCWASTHALIAAQIL